MWFHKRDWSLHGKTLLWKILFAYQGTSLSYTSSCNLQSQDLWSNVSCFQTVWMSFTLLNSTVSQSSWKSVWLLKSIRTWRVSQIILVINTTEIINKQLTDWTISVWPSHTTLLCKIFKNYCKLTVNFNGNAKRYNFKILGLGIQDAWIPFYSATCQLCAVSKSSNWISKVGRLIGGKHYRHCFQSNCHMFLPYIEYPLHGNKNDHNSD